MVKDYNWLGFGGEFGLGDERAVCRRFMNNVKVGLHLLDDAARPAPTSDRDADSVYLVFKQDATKDEPEILPDGRQHGTLLFTVANNWLSDDFLDETHGPWHATAVVMLVLAQLHRSGAVRLPRLGAHS